MTPSFAIGLSLRAGPRLSKAHKLIYRFSEDVDLAILDAPKSDSQTKKLLKNIEEVITTEPLRSIEKERRYV